MLVWTVADMDSMITAARLIGHKSINGKYLSTMAMDKFQHLGHQMTHSIDSFITDSANSATALYTGHKSTVNSLGVYRDSSPSTFDDPKIETIAELFKARRGGQVGIVSTAFIADATPAALVSHTPDRDLYGTVIESYLYGVTRNYTWSNWNGPDVLFGGGAESFLVGNSVHNTSFYSQFAAAGYNTVLNQTALYKTSNSSRTLGIFCQSNLNKWLDRNVYKSNLVGMKNDPSGGNGDALDQPGLANMTTRAIDILHQRDQANNNSGFFLMSEAASIDKMMHVLDYDRALGDLLELDSTITATIAKLSALGILNDTLIITTADHGHGFDVFGSADTKYLADQTTDRAKRNAIGTYQNSGLSQYIASDMSGIPGFPTQWDPRYTLAQGFGAHPDVREDYAVHKNVTGVGSRQPDVAVSNSSSNYVVNPKDSPKGFVTNGTLPVSNNQGVHSLTDVPVFASGPGSELFSGVYNSVDIFFKIASALQLAM